MSSEGTAFGGTIGRDAGVFETRDVFEDDVGHAARGGDLGEFGELEAREGVASECAGEGGRGEFEVGRAVLCEAA